MDFSAKCQLLTREVRAAATSGEENSIKVKSFHLILPNKAKKEYILHELRKNTFTIEILHSGKQVATIVYLEQKP